MEQPEVDDEIILEEEGVPSLVELILRWIIKNIKLFDSFHGALDDGLLQRLISMLKKENKLSNATMKLIFELQNLDLSGQFIGEASLKLIGRQCTSLLSLNLSGLFSTTTDVVMEPLVKKCTLLRTLDVSDCKYVSDKTLLALSKNCTNLLSLNLRGLPSISENGVTTLVNKCTNLRTLNISKTSISEEAANSMLRKFPQLQVISNSVEPIFFRYDTDVPYGPLSNHSPHPIIMDGKEYPTAQHYFQSQKYVGVDDEYAEKIRTAPTPGAAKKLGSNRSKPTRPHWDDIKQGVMFDLYFAKFTQHAELKKLLLSTGKRPLVRHARDVYWGDKLDGSGHNYQGKILTAVREKIRETEEKNLL